MKEKYGKLIKNTAIFAVGTFGSKILSFLIVPLYTYVLSTSDYGKIDLFLSTINLLIPFSTLLIYEAAIRFLIGKECKEKNVFNNCIFVFLIGNIISILISPIVLSFLGLLEYIAFFIILMILTNFSTIFGQYLRAIDDNWGFSLSGIINTFVIVFSNLLFLLVFKLGIRGYFYALLCSQLATSIYIAIRCKMFSNINFKYIDFKLLKNMMKYSIPLVPNNLMWWIMNAGDKYVINYFLGDSANGIFSISYKIPTILTMFFSIFMQAWQVSAIEERMDASRNNFYKTVCNYLALILVILSSLIILLIEPLFNKIIGPEFNTAWLYVPLLSIATLFNCFSTFAGVVYIVNKDSKKAFYTTFLGAIINLFLNFLLIRKYGLIGVAIGTIIGYGAVMILRFLDFKKEFGVNLVNKKFIILIFILTVEAISYILIKNNFKYIISIIFILIILIVFRSDIMVILEKFIGKIKKNFGRIR